MTVAERKIRIPFKEYDVLVKSNIMRKLTIMEWTLLHVVKDFSALPLYQNKTLSFFFEELLGMTRSELLIRPCLNDMITNGLIAIEGYSPYDMVGNILIRAIKLTELGAVTVQRGYVPGDIRETGEKIFYNLLNEEYVESIGAEYGSVLRGFSYSYCDDSLTDEYQFEEDSVRRGINRGKLLKDKYHAESVEAIEVHETSSCTVWYTTKIAVDIDSEGAITSNLPINQYTENVIDQILSEDQPWKGSAETELESWDSKRALPEGIFCGEEVLDEVMRASIAENTILLHSKLWDSVSETIQELSDHTVIVFASPRFSFNHGKNMVIRITSQLPDENTLLAYGDKVLQEYLVDMNYGGREKKHYAAIYSERDPSSFADGVRKVLQEEAVTSPEVSIAYLLPFMNHNIEQFDLAVLTALGRMKSSKEQIKLLTKLVKAAEKSKVSIGDIKIFNETIAKAIELEAPPQQADLLVEFGTHIYKEYQPAFEELLLRIVQESQYTDVSDYLIVLSTLLTSFGIIEADYFVLRADNAAANHISEEMLKAFYSQLWHKSAAKVPELLSVSKPYNAILESRNYISKQTGLRWEERNDRDEVLENLMETDDIGKIIDSVHRMKDSLSLAPQDCTPEIVLDNISFIEQLIRSFGYQKNEENVTYLIDTCVFMHTPRILDYFRPGEIVRIPFAVLQELDYHKDNNPDSNLKRTAAFACKQIEQYASGEYNNQVMIFLEAEDYADLLPSSFDKRKHDNLILSAAFRYKALHPIILTDDTNFRNISRSQGIRVKEWKAFVDERGGVSVRSTDLPIKNSIQEPETVDSKEIDTVKDKVPDAAGDKDTNKEDYLSQTIDVMKLPPYNLSGKNVKTLQSAGFAVLNDLYVVTASVINQKLKSTSARTMARQAHDRLTAKVDNSFNNRETE